METRMHCNSALRAMGAIRLVGGSIYIQRLLPCDLCHDGDPKSLVHFLSLLGNSGVYQLAVVERLDLERKYPRGTVDGINADPKEVGTVEKRVRENDTEPRGVLNPERDKKERELFSPGGEDVARKESGMNGPELKSGRRRPGGEAPISPEAETAVDVPEERRSGQAGHVLGRTWPSQVRTTDETGHGEAGICFL
ncbi:hypothetical protein NDU88_003911 [Pleurodeles waltl]|uniref:Uncharacterized protein n=1 Tax=Pleurodeles waltl TaxID=8319 RepID=A0AAV7VFK9_PLEWA|nr:hypothetical protein NDU88_003911 [Pleurodeles waltl]